MNNKLSDQKEITIEQKQQEIIKHQIQLLERASSEIKLLKQRNAILYAKQDVFDKTYRMMTMNDRDNNNLCESPANIEREIERHINNLNE